MEIRTLTKPVTKRMEEQIRDLLSKATKRPWDIRREDVTCGYFSYQIHRVGTGGHLASTSEDLHEDNDRVRAKWDAELIMEGTNQMEALLDERIQMKALLTTSLIALEAMQKHGAVLTEVMPNIRAFLKERE